MLILKQLIFEMFSIEYIHSKTVEISSSYEGIIKFQCFHSNFLCDIYIIIYIITNNDNEN